jgi:manganese/zinc/iron transport system ATP- binding protein
MRLVASGPTETVFTRANLQKTYGGRLDVLEAAGRAYQAGERTA